VTEVGEEAQFVRILHLSWFQESSDAKLLFCNGECQLVVFNSVAGRQLVKIRAVGVQTQHYITSAYYHMILT